MTMKNCCLKTQKEAIERMIFVIETNKPNIEELLGALKYALSDLERGKDE